MATLKKLIAHIFIEKQNLVFYYKFYWPNVATSDFVVCRDSYENMCKFVNLLIGIFILCIISPTMLPPQAKSSLNTFNI